MIDHQTGHDHLGGHGVKFRLTRHPPPRIGHGQCLFNNQGPVDRLRCLGRGHRGAGRIADGCLQRHISCRAVVFQRCCQAHPAGCLGDFRCGQACAPVRDMNRMKTYQAHMTIQPGAGIPAGCLCRVLQADRDQVVLAGSNMIGQVQGKRRIAVGPSPDQNTVAVDLGMTHRPVDFQADALAGQIAGNRDDSPIPAHTNMRESAGSTGDFFHTGSHIGLLVLDPLDIVFPVKGTGNCPVMRHAHGFPIAIVAFDRRVRGVIVPREPPTVLERDCLPTHGRVFSRSIQRDVFLPSTGRLNVSLYESVTGS